MQREKLTCTICGMALENGLDTFGDIGEELCQECWIHLPEIIGQERGKPNVVMIVEFEPDGKKVKSITHKIVEDDDDVFDYEQDDEDNFDKALSECGVMSDGLCSMAGSEFCDWECPLLKFGFHGTEIDDDDEVTS